VVTGAALIGVWLGGSHPFTAVIPTLVFGLLFMLAELRPIQVKHAFGPPVSYSISFVIAVAALVALGPVQAIICALFGALDPELRVRADWFGRMVFNAAQLALSTAAMGAMYVLLHGTIGSLTARDFPYVLVPLFAGAATYLFVNTSAVSAMVMLVRRVPFRRVWWSAYHAFPLTQFAFALLGLLLAVLYATSSFWALTIVVIPLLVARNAFKAAAEMQDAYEATLRSLISAIEAKDAYTRGHAERVSQLTEMIARTLRLPEPKVQALRIAALMHDVGKLAVSTTILTKPGKLTPEEYEHMKTHPVHGTDIVSEIDFLRDGNAVEAVRHHHERMDGKGYPDGLAGLEIPLTARVVMVADAFDSMTSTRSYRPAMAIERGMAELRKWEGVQFDPKIVDALERAIERFGWEPHPETFVGELTPRPAVSVHADV
jgi:hypothetical protein